MGGVTNESVGAGRALRRIGSPGMGLTNRLSVHGLGALALVDQLITVAVVARRCEIEGRRSYERKRRSVQPRRLEGLKKHWRRPKGAAPQKSRPRLRCG